MKASELIKEIQDMIDAEGDREIYIAVSVPHLDESTYASCNFSVELLSENHGFEIGGEGDRIVVL